MDSNPELPQEPHSEPSQQVAPLVVSPKEKLLDDLQAALISGVVQENDIRALLHSPVTTTEESHEQVTIESKPKNKMTAVEVMFNIAGIVLFASIMSMIAETWDQRPTLLHIGLSAGVGAALWLVAYIINKQQVTSEVRKGLESSLLITGMLCILVGGFITTDVLIGGFPAKPFVPVAVTLAVLGAIHFLYDRLVRKDLVILMALVLSVAVFPTIVFGILASRDYPVDVWSVVIILSVLLLVYASRVLEKMHPDRPFLKNPFDSLAVFLVLATMFGSTFTDYGIIWQFILILSILGLFYLSIIKRSKNFLGDYHRIQIFLWWRSDDEPDNRHYRITWIGRYRLQHQPQIF
jgi:hypothetical protein